MRRVLHPLLIVLMAGTAIPAVDYILPDPLRYTAGGTVATGADWLARRRPELLEIFAREVYGRAPVDRPADLAFTVTSAKAGVLGGAANLSQVRIAWKGPHGAGGMDLVLFVPAKRTAPVPCLLLICNRSKARNMDPTRERKSEFWPVEEIIARGYATAAFHNGDVDPDKDDGFRDGVHGVFDEPLSPRPGDSWATIAAWAWGARRAVDYLVTAPGIDAGRLAVVGQSRGGKTALWAGAQDPRIALTISNCSGSAGAAANRGKTSAGQSIAAINREFPWWFAGNYANWNGKEATLPFDQHEVVALCAPRLVYVASASNDWGADPKSEFRSCVEASPVWKLWGMAGISSTTMPAADTPLHDGSIGYHLRRGDHDLTLYDWQRFMDFADKRLTPDHATNVVTIGAGGSGTVVVSRTGSTRAPLAVALAFGGTAAEYAKPPAMLVIPAGAAEARLDLRPTRAGAGKTVAVSLPLDGGYALGASTSATVRLGRPAGGG